MVIAVRTEEADGGLVVVKEARSDGDVARLTREAAMLARSRHPGQAEDLHGGCRTGSGYRTSSLVQHRPDAPAGPSTGNGFDILNPFAPVDGLLTAKNLWKAGHMEIDSPVYLVVPGNPDDSFLIDKLRNH